jgi:hypothetical protein
MWPDRISGTAASSQLETAPSPPTRPNREAGCHAGYPAETCPIGDTLRIGSVVTSHRRPGAVGIVKTTPFDDRDFGGRRAQVWVDYSATSGAVGIDYVRNLVVFAGQS